MRKRFAFPVLLAVFAMGAVVGLRAPGAQAGPCFYKCICSVPYKCCTTSYGTSCKKDTSGTFQCPQVYDC
jgi:hypothetical protein